MGKIEELVDSARHLSLHPLCDFHSTLDGHLAKIYSGFPADATEKAHYFETTQNESAPQGKSTTDPLASLDSFRSYMKDAGSSAQALVYQEEPDAPISDYFVSSSHNTYLTGNQLYSDAAASAYTSVLLQGCRSVEIDVWDGLPEDSSSEGSGNGTSASSSDAEVANKPPKPTFKDKLKSKLESQEKTGTGLTRSLSKKVNKRWSYKAAKPADVTAEAANVATEKKPSKVEPRVLHGHTLTKGTTFREICYAIRDSAFVYSDLPVIISFEVHACLEQQQMMVDIINEAWKGLLVEVESDTDTEKQPKLSDLRRKILIKTKSVPVPSKDAYTDEVDKDDSLETVDTSATEQDAEPDAAQKPAKPAKILEALAKMAVYTRAYHFSHFEQPEAKTPNHVFSLSEKAAREAHITHRDALFEHNRYAFMRIYPYAMRVTSSNLDPTFYWRRGAQLVALNWQRLDKGMMLNHGMFDGTPGWQLKPPGYRSSKPDEGICRANVDLTIELFAAQDLPLPQGRTEKSFRPYVVVQLHVEEPQAGAEVPDGDDTSSDAEKSSYRRRGRGGVGANPDFEGQNLVFPTVTGVVQELGFVRFKIKDDEFGRDPLAAWACIRLDRLRAGYRLVHLRDATGGKTGGVLLVRVTKQIS